jgi:hypothetical protein
MLRTKAILAALVVALALVSAMLVSKADASDPPWGNTTEGRVSHLESELHDTQGDMSYAFARIRTLDAKVAALQRRTRHDSH